MDSVLSRTPSSKLKMVFPNTIGFFQALHSANANLCTDGKRRLFLEDLREDIPQVELDVFFKNGFLPSIRDDIDVEKVLDKLNEGQSRILLPSSKWNYIDKTNIVNEKEDRVYSKLVDVINAIAVATGISTTERTLTFQCITNEVLISITHDNNAMPDFVGTLAGAHPGRNEWADIAVPAQFKTSNGVDETNDVRHFYISET